MIKPAKHGRDHLPWGEDPIPGITPYLQLGTNGNIQAGQHVDLVGGHVAVPHHPDYSVSAIGWGGFEPTGDGGIILPGGPGNDGGMYHISVDGWINDSDWQTKNFTLVVYRTIYPLQTLSNVLGSALGPSTLEHGYAHDGTGLINPTDRRKPEMQWDYLLATPPGSDFGLGQQGLAIYPTYYSAVAFESTGWVSFSTKIVKLSTAQPEFLPGWT